MWVELKNRRSKTPHGVSKSVELDAKCKVASLLFPSIKTRKQ
jgi:hypothetical protein